MSKSYKPINAKYIESTGVTHNKTLLSTYLNSLFSINSTVVRTDNTNPSNLFGGGTWSLIEEACDTRCVGSQVIYPALSGNGTVNKTAIMGDYDYEIFKGMFDNMTIPSGYHKEYKMTFQGTTGSNNELKLYLNNIETTGIQTWSANTFRVIASTVMFKESDITLVPTYGYQRNGINLYYSVTGVAAGWEFRDVTIHAYLVSDTKRYVWKRTA